MDTTRRGMMTAAGAAAAIAAAGGPAFAAWEPNERYPDPAITSLDPAFNKYRIAQSTVERIATGCRWNEGPVYMGDWRSLLWSDIPNNRVMRTEYDGSVTVLMDKFDGKPLNSPNDIVVKSDDSIWFTDPPFGILGNYEGHVATPELPTNVYRLDKTGQLTVATGEVNRPNGLAFSPDESKLYVVEAALTPRVIQVFDVTDNGTKLANKRAFIAAEPGGTPDGFRVDVDGNLWCGWGMGNEKQDGVKVFDPTGKPIGFIGLPERCANVCFGGVKRNRLFMAASHSLYSLYVNTQGAPGG